jgi:hypothetical protein
MGYDLEFFGFFREYLFFPWLAIIVSIFLVTEARARFANKRQWETIARKGNILNLAINKVLPELSMDSFLFLTRHGSELSIIGGYVVDISTFVAVHPGGANVLRFAVGSDITPYFTGALEINGRRHTHSANALGALRPLVKWKLIESEPKPEVKERRTSLLKRIPVSRSLDANHSSKEVGTSTEGSRHSILAGHVFRNAEIVGLEDVVSEGNDSQNEKRIIKLSIMMARNEVIDIHLGTPMPTATFIFRYVDSDGVAFERPYTAAGCQARPMLPSNKLRKFFLNSRVSSVASTAQFQLSSSYSNSPLLSSHIIYEFFISLIPGGKMSSVLAKKKIGGRIMVKGPMACMNFMTKLNRKSWSDVCLLVQGSGIAPGLQLIDYFLQMNEPPRISLLWCVQKQHSNFDNTLKLGDREQFSSDHFQYIIVECKENTTKLQGSKKASKLTGFDDKETLLQLCQSQGIHHPDTVAAMLLWAGCNVKDDVDDKWEDSTLVNLHRIGESLRSGLLLTDETHDRQSGKLVCFRGCDAVSFIVGKGYTPSHESAVTLGRELALKLKLFKHTRDDKQLLLDSEDEYYMFCEDTPPLHMSATSREGEIRRLRLSRNMLLAVCGRIKFEEDTMDIFKRAGAVDDQIFQFPEGSTPLYALSQFIPERTNDIVLTNDRGHSIAVPIIASFGDETNQTCPRQVNIVAGLPATEDEHDSSIQSWSSGSKEMCDPELTEFEQWLKSNV